MNKKRFIITHAPGTTTQDTEFRNQLKAHEVGWWHWYQGTWLVVNSAGHLSSAALRDLTVDIYENANCMVFEVPDGDVWSGFGPSGSGRDMFAWLNRNW